MRPIRAFLMIVGCASCAIVGPDYSQPAINLPAEFAFAKSTALIESATDPWWEKFEDPVLSTLMMRGLAQNLDIKVAQERISEAQARYRAAGGTSQISGDATLSSQYSRTTGGDGSRRDQSLFGATYVFDLFGGFARAKEEAAANLGATIEEAATVRLAYQAELVSAYIEARTAQVEHGNLLRGIENRRRTLDLIEQQLAAGGATRLQSVRADAELVNLKADLPSRQLNYEQSAVRIAALLDESTVKILNDLSHGPKRIPSTREPVSTGIPTDLLRNRPDVRAAERRFAAAMAAVGVAEASLYPSLTLGGNIRVDGDNTLSVGPSLTIPVLDRGRLLANRDVAISEARQAELSWQLTVRSAIGDVEQNLTNLHSRHREISALSIALQRYRTLRDLSEESYGFGVTTLLELLDAEQNETNTANALARAKRSYAIALSELAVAVGHGASIGFSSDQGS